MRREVPRVATWNRVGSMRRICPKVGQKSKQPATRCQAASGWRVSGTRPSPGTSSHSMWIHDVRDDLVHALRTLQRSPAFAAVAIVSLALGIGANTLAFSIVHALVLQ